MKQVVFIHQSVDFFLKQPEETANLFIGGSEACHMSCWLVIEQSYLHFPLICYTSSD